MAKVDLTLNPLVLFSIESSVFDETIDLNETNTILFDLGWDDTARSVDDVKGRYNELKRIDGHFIWHPQGNISLQRSYPL